MAKKTASPKQKVDKSRISFSYDRKKHTGSVTEAEFGGQRTVTVSVPMGGQHPELFYFTWISDEELFWNDIPIDWKQGMARAIAKELVK